MQVIARTEIAGVKADLVFDYQPLEKETLTDPEKPEEAELEQVIVGGVDIYSIIEELDSTFIAAREQDLLTGEYEEE